MWTCPKCQREFLKDKQRHYCSAHTIDDIFAGRAENVVLAFDALLLAVGLWEPQTIGAGKSAVIFNNTKAWLVVRPMKSVLDVCFFYGEILQSPVLHSARKDSMGNKFAHHVRLSGPDDVTPEVVDLLKVGFEYMLPKRLRGEVHYG